MDRTQNRPERLLLMESKPTIKADPPISKHPRQIPLYLGQVIHSFEAKDHLSRNAMNDVIVPFGLVE